ncbi:MAG: DUF4388 domain-containing protein, partial [Sandaracinaceae bacterium]|nr:DUF4388 domain-containing protein [Sandaracinaceae bacterium]
FLTTLSGERERIRGYELGVDDYLAKPVEPKGLLLRVARMVASSRSVPASQEAPESSALRGDLAQVSIASLLAFAEAERRSGRLRVRGPLGEAVLGLHAGTVTSVELASASASDDPFERLLALLDWTDGRFELEQVEIAASEDALSIQGALLEHARRVDEQR